MIISKAQLRVSFSEEELIFQSVLIEKKQSNLCCN